MGLIRLPKQTRLKSESTEFHGMSKILQDFVPSTLIGAMEDNTIENIETWTGWAKSKLHQDADLTWPACHIPCFLFNLASSAGNALSMTESLIDVMISRARSRKVPIGWWVGPSIPPPSRLGDAPRGQGLRTGR